MLTCSSSLHHSHYFLNKHKCFSLTMSRCLFRNCFWLIIRRSCQNHWRKQRWKRLDVFSTLSKVIALTVICTAWRSVWSCWRSYFPFLKQMFESNHKKNPPSITGFRNHILWLSANATLAHFLGTFKHIEQTEINTSIHLATYQIPISTLLWAQFVPTPEGHFCLISC